MITYKKKTKTIYVQDKVICDVCGEEQIDCNIDELTSFDFYAGYASHFGDMNHIKCDVCHKCLFKMIGEYCRVNEDETDNNYTTE